MCTLLAELCLGGGCVAPGWLSWLKSVYTSGRATAPNSFQPSSTDIGTWQLDWPKGELRACCSSDAPMWACTCGRSNAPASLSLSHSGSPARRARQRRRQVEPGGRLPTLQSVMRVNAGSAHTHGSAILGWSQLADISRSEGE